MSIKYPFEGKFPFGQSLLWPLVADDKVVKEKWMEKGLPRMRGEGRAAEIGRNWERWKTRMFGELGTTPCRFLDTTSLPCICVAICT